MEYSVRIWLLLFCFFLTKGFSDPTNLHDKYISLLQNTIWVVPPSTLRAYQYSSGTSTPVVDQTVWFINSYVGGYFFGTSYTYISPTTYSTRIFVGSITNNGTVYITFYPSDGSLLSTDLVNGIGTFTYEQGNYRFTMQMNSGSALSGVAHWSYMVSVTEDSPYYNDLPGVGTSIPVFLQNF